MVCSLCFLSYPTREHKSIKTGCVNREFLIPVSSYENRIRQIYPRDIFNLLESNIRKHCGHMFVYVGIMVNHAYLFLFMTVRD